MTRPRRWMIATAVASVVLAGCTSASSGPIATPSAAPSTTSDGPSPADLSSSATAGTTDGSTATSAPPVATPSVLTTVVSLAPGVSDEASGIAEARGTPGAFFLVDDATGTDGVVAVAADGALLARIEVAGMSADNAEAMAAGTCGPLPMPVTTAAAERCLYVGDIGDNAARREDIAIFRFAEPGLIDIPVDPVAADEWRYTYPDGPHNAEAMILTADGSLLVVTKPAGGLPHRMYRAAPGGGELAFVREFRPPAAERPLRTLVTGNVVTDLAATPGRVLMLTYDEVREFTAPTPDADLASFPDWPHRRLPMPWLAQAEAATGAADGCGYAVASEAGPGGGTGSLAMMTCAPTG